MNLRWENRTIPGGIAVLSGERHEAGRGELRPGERLAAPATFGFRVQFDAHTTTNCTRFADGVAHSLGKASPGTRRPQPADAVVR